MMFNPIMTGSLHLLMFIALVYFTYSIVSTPGLLRFSLKAILGRRHISIILGATILVCMMALTVMGGYFQHSFWGLSESTIRSETGHFQIYQAGYAEHGKQEPWKYKLTQYKSLVESLKKDPFLATKIDVIAPELNFSGLISNGDTSATFVARAVEPAADRKLSAFGETITQGQRFSSGDEGVGLIGKGVATQLAASPGTILTLLSNSPNDGMAATDLEVKGVTESFSEDYDDVAVKLTLSNAWDMLGTESVDRVIILLKSSEDLLEVMNYTQDLLSQKGFMLEYRDWKSLATFYGSVERLYKNIFTFFSTVIMLFALLFIGSVLMIMTTERTDEIALLRAFGAQPNSILKGFVNETILLGFVMGAIALVLCLGAVAVFNQFGIEAPPPPGASKGYLIKLRVFETPWFVLHVFEFIVCAVFLSCLFPAYQGCKANIIQALRNG